MRSARKPQLRGAERRALKAIRKAAKKAKPPKPPRIKQFPSVFREDLPEAVQGIARVLSRGLPDER